jgi:tetrahydromethanopterin S-methyltransferase subunit G
MMVLVAISRQLKEIGKKIETRTGNKIENRIGTKTGRKELGKIRKSSVLFPILFPVLFSVFFL